MTDQLSNFTSLRNIEPGTWAIEGIGGTKLFAHGIGDIRVSRTVNGEKQSGEIKDVLFVPGLSVNLISIACVPENGYNVTFNNDTANVNGKIIMVGTRVVKTLYRLDISTDQLVTKGMAASSNTAPLDIWHERIAHANERIIKKMATGEAVTGMSISPNSKQLNECCHGCNVGKMHKLPFTPSQSKTHRVGELIHSDLVGPMQVASPNGTRYYVLFKDDFSLYKAVYFLKLKSDTSESFKTFSQKIFNQTGNRIETLRSDNGGEYTGQDFKDWMAINGIRQQTSAAYTPQQNGKAERDHRTTVEAARSLIHAKGIPLKLWAEAVNHSVYTLNRTVSEKKNATPFELWHGKKPDISNLRIFG